MVISRMLRVARELLRPLVQFFPLFVGVLQAYYMHQVHITSSMGTLPLTLTNLPYYGFSVFSVMLSGAIVIAIGRTSWQRFVLACLFLLFFNVLISYHFASHQLFNYAFLADNIGLMGSSDSWFTIGHSLDWSNMAYWPVLCLIMLGVHIKWDAFKPVRFYSPAWHGIGLVAVYVACAWAPIRTHDPLLSFIHSAAFYYKNPISSVAIQPKQPNQTLEPSVNKPMVNAQNPPHVFLILIESFNANHQALVNEKNQPVTPFLNQLSKHAITVDAFYGNSVQTAKGMAAAMFSAMPSFRSKLFTSFPSIQLSSPFNELHKLGYRSLFFLGHDDLSYDYRHQFLKKHGIHFTKTVYDMLDDSDHALLNRWGLSDDRVMHHYFTYFDNIKTTHDGPLFSTILTSQSHVPFMVPEHIRLAYPNAKSTQEHYANSMANVDMGIRMFFDGLKQRGLDDQSIVIITGDHAFPMGQHGITSLENGFYEESYRMPFFLVVPKALPRRLQGAFSQVDIMPTIFDLLNHRVTNSTFMGASIFAEKKDRAVLQIQPYAKQIGVVKYPIKYRYSVKENKEYVHHMEKDSLETNNIVDTIDAEALAAFRRQVSQVLATQKYYEGFR